MRALAGVAPVTAGAGVTRSSDTRQAHGPALVPVGADTAGIEYSPGVALETGGGLVMGGTNIGGLEPPIVKASRRGPAAELLPLTADRRRRVVADRADHGGVSSYRLVVARQPSTR